MKMRPEHYRFLKDKVEYAMELDINLFNAYQSGQISGKRYRWDLLYQMNLSPFICDYLYSYLNDDHIDTALRKITKTA